MNDFFGIISLPNKSISSNIDKSFKTNIFDGDDLILGNTAFFRFSKNNKHERQLTFGLKYLNITMCGYARIDNKKEIAKKINCSIDAKESEFILNAYLYWGENLVNEIVGSFAFIIIDKNKIIGFRDHMGMKPFYYFKNKDLLIVSSKIRFIKALKLFKNLMNRDRVIDYLLYIHPKEGETFFQDIKKLPRASKFIYINNNFNIHNYFNFDHSKTFDKNFDEDEIIINFEKILVNVVNESLDQDENKIGIALSGGLDSSALLSILDSNMDGKKIFSKSAIFNDLDKLEAPKSYETNYIEDAIRDKKNVIHEFLSIRDTGAFKWLDEMDDIFDQPISAINGYIFESIFKSLRGDNVKVFLDGIDGDSVVSHGNEIFGELGRSLQLKKIYKIAIEYSKFHSLGRPSLYKLFKKYIFLNNMPKSILWFLLNKNNFHPFLVHKLLSKKSKRHIGSLKKSIEKHYGRFPLKHSGNARKEHMHNISGGNWENDLEDLDYLASYYNIDHRTPFFDKRLMEFCLKTPSSLKLKNGINRYYFRKSMKKYLPENIAFRASKSDLSPMNNQNFKNYAIYRIKDEVLNESPLDGLIDKDSVKKIIDSNINNSSNTYILFQLYSLSKWMKSNNFEW